MLHALAGRRILTAPISPLAVMRGGPTCQLAGLQCHCSLSFPSMATPVFIKVGSGPGMSMVHSLAGMRPGPRRLSSALWSQQLMLLVPEEGEGFAVGSLADLACRSRAQGRPLFSYQDFASQVQASEELDDNMLVISEDTEEELVDELDRYTPYSASKPCVWPAVIAL